MSKIVVYAPTDPTVANRVTTYNASGDQNDYSGETNKLVNPPDAAGVISGGIISTLYWKYDGVSDVIEMSQAEKDLMDASLAPPTINQTQDSDTESTTTAETFQLKNTYSITQALPATFTHRCGWYCEINNDTVGGRVEVEVRHNDTDVLLGAFGYEFTNTADWIPCSGYAYLPAGTDPTEITLKYRRQVSGTAKIRRARIDLIYVR